MRFGLIGAGAIGKIRADALANSPVCELVAVADLDEARARVAAPGATYYADANQLTAAKDVELDAPSIALMGIASYSASR